MPVSCVFPLPPWYLKRCSACGDDKDQRAFGFHPSTSDGLRGRCNTCRVKEVGAYNRANPKAAYVRNKRWRKKHPETLKAGRQRQHVRTYPKNAEKLRARTRDYRAANAEKVDAWWKSDHGRMIRCLNEGRRRTRAAAAPATLTVDEWRLIVAAFDGLCAYGCGARWEEIDHVLALSRGGGLTADNVLPACGACNVSKHARSFEDFCAARKLDAAEILARALSLFRSRSNRAAA